MSRGIGAGADNASKGCTDGGVGKLQSGDSLDCFAGAQIGYGSRFVGTDIVDFLFRDKLSFLERGVARGILRRALHPGLLPLRPAAGALRNRRGQAGSVRHLF